ncbi:hypothetical protein DNFV4_00314 [Nitrospira tepida]|uniref:Uncharacterized protein n=1 Tax=Nitrospira tepida TaxID=2973512 RepID=A0AA86MVQ8_9BACT|nr:hypothetical protein [Nitrospira tepida]CAI4029894.1 hypothetical protein DNFV4_00314 [Nitrospira tepida]
MNGALPFVDAVKQAADQMLLVGYLAGGIVLVVGVALVLHEAYLEARRNAGRVWKDREEG